MGAAWSFAAVVSVGMKLAAARDVVNDALDSVYDAAEAVMDYVRAAASSAFVKLDQGTLGGREGTYSHQAGAPPAWPQGSRGGEARDVPCSGGRGARSDVLSRASARVAVCGRLLEAAVARREMEDWAAAWQGSHPGPRRPKSDTWT